MGGDNDAVNPLRDRRQVGKAAIAFDLLRVRVDGEDFIARPPQLAVDQVRRLTAARARHPGHRDPLAGQEVPDRFSEILHRFPLRSNSSPFPCCLAGGRQEPFPLVAPSIARYHHPTGQRHGKSTPGRADHPPRTPVSGGASKVLPSRRR